MSHVPGGSLMVVAFTLSRPAVVPRRLLSMHGAVEGQISGQSLCLKHSEWRKTHMTDGSRGALGERQVSALNGLLAACGSSYCMGGLCEAPAHEANM